MLAQGGKHGYLDNNGSSIKAQQNSVWSVVHFTKNMIIFSFQDPVIFLFHLMTQ